MNAQLFADYETKFGTEISDILYIPPYFTDNRLPMLMRSAIERNRPLTKDDFRRVFGSFTQEEVW
jgi:hypothetical protein